MPIRSAALPDNTELMTGCGDGRRNAEHSPATVLWCCHALTTGSVAGLLVVLVTVLVIDQVVRFRQINSRARVVAVQAAIMVT